MILSHVCKFYLLVLLNAVYILLRCFYDYGKFLNLSRLSLKLQKDIFG